MSRGTDHTSGIPTKLHTIKISTYRCITVLSPEIVTVYVNLYEVRLGIVLFILDEDIDDHQC